MAHHHQPHPHHHYVSPSRYSVSDETAILDFGDLPHFGDLPPEEKDLAAMDAEAEEEYLEEIAEKDPTELLESEDIDGNVSYPLVAWAHPPSGVPGQCLKLLWFKWRWYVWLRSQFLVSESSTIQCGVIRGYLSVHNDRYRHILLNPYMIHPYSNFAVLWSVFVGLFTASLLIYAPFMIAFYEFTFFHKNYSILVALESSILFLDILIQFFIGIENRYSRQVYLDRQMIVRNYLSGWFVIDIATRIPFDYIVFMSLPLEVRSTRLGLAWVRVFAFVLRITRFRPVYQFLSRMATMFVFKWSVVTWMIKILILFFLNVHWLACLHFLLPSIYNDPQHPKPLSWITKRTGDLWKQPVWVKYLHCYLRALGYLCTIDGGNFIPFEVEEIICSIIGIVCAQTCFGYFISSFTIMVNTVNEASEKYSEMLELTEDYLQYQKSSANYRERVMLYFERKYRRHVFPDTFLLGTLSPILRADILRHNCRALVERTSIFRDLPTFAITNIAQHLQYEVFVPGDILLEPNTVGDRMYFIQSGDVDILSQFGTLIATLTDGHFFGEIALISGEKRMKIALATSVCEIYILTKKNFDECVITCPQVYERILNVAQDRLQAEFDSLLEAARKKEDFEKWKEAGKKLKQEIEEENNYVVKTFGLHFVNDEFEDTQSTVSQTNLPAGHHTLSHHSGKLSTKTNRRNESEQYDNKSGNSTVEKMLTDVKIMAKLANTIRKKDKKKKNDKKK